MSIYEEMHAKYLAWNAVIDDYEMKATSGMINFRDAFSEYLGAPDKTISLYNVDLNSDGHGRYRNVDHFGQILRQDVDGNWRFAVKTLFQVGQTFVELFFDIRMQLEEDGFVFSNALDKNSPHLRCKFADERSALSSFFAYLAQLISETFDRKPWDGPDRNPIGFFPQTSIK